MDYLVPGFRDNQVLRKINLEDNFITDSGCKEILRALEKNEGLMIREFKLKNNLISDMQVAQFDIWMRAHARDLKAKRKESKRSRSGSKGRRGSRASSRDGSRSASRGRGSSKGKQEGRSKSPRRT
mmetsp:Transcript_7045/g.17487  ORF Transcript_7045/g.17487 Transcript_7045/m.17487 type:complete len:126 (-) Transcript_7045:37-414(-)